MSLLVASLYLLCLAFLFGSALYVWSRNPFARLNASYAALAAALLGWVGTLFLFMSQAPGPGLLWLGRANFAAAVLIAPAALTFVRSLARSRPSRIVMWLWLESMALALLSLLTGAVDRSEALAGAQHVTSYGPLFTVYIAHLVGFAVTALIIAFRPAPALPREGRAQLRLVGVGILATGAVGITANAILPYLYGDFRFIDAGTLSTIFFLAAVAYAATVHHLFDMRVLVRATFVYGVLVAFAVELYQVAVESITRLLPLGDPAGRHVAAAAVALTVNAFTHEPLRRLLEQLADRLLAKKAQRRQQSRD
jgi:hypothetical protein